MRTPWETQPVVPPVVTQHWWAGVRSLQAPDPDRDKHGDQAQGRSCYKKLFVVCFCAQNSSHGSDVSVGRLMSIRPREALEGTCRYRGTGSRASGAKSTSDHWVWKGVRSPPAALGPSPGEAPAAPLQQTLLAGRPPRQDPGVSFRRLRVWEDVQ